MLALQTPDWKYYNYQILEVEQAAEPRSKTANEVKRGGAAAPVWVGTPTTFLREYAVSVLAMPKTVPGTEGTTGPKEKNPA